MGVYITIVLTVNLLAVIMWPKIGWYVCRWGYKNMELNDEVLTLSRFSAIVFLFILWLVIVPISCLV